MRPLLALSLNLVSLFPELHITFIVASVIQPTAQSEIARFFGTESAAAASRLRLMPLGKQDVDPKDIVTQLTTLIEALPPVFASLLSAKTDGQGFDRRITLAVADVRTRDH